MNRNNTSKNILHVKKNINSNLKCVSNIIHNYLIDVIENNVSYINRLFPFFGQKTSVLLFCINNSENSLIKKIENSDNESNHESCLDLTGSPLKHSFGDDSFTITITPMKRNWLENEEEYSPIPRKKGIELLNILQKNIGFDKSWTSPIFALCNPKMENTKNVLIGSFYNSEWFMTFDVKVSGIESLKNLQTEYAGLLKKHLGSSSYTDVNISVTSFYELYGINHKMFGWRKEQTRDSKGYLQIEGQWNSLSFFPPLTTHSNNLDAEIISGSTSSSLNDLWNQLSILHEFISMVDDYHKRYLSSRYSVQPLIFPKNFVNPYFQDEDSVRDRLIRFLMGDYYTENNNKNQNEECSVQDVNDKDFQLITFVKELSQRQNLDFTDEFWQIVRCADSYILMTDCVHEVFESITHHNFKPEFNSMEDTRFAKMVSAVFDEQKVSLHAGSISMELVIDMGMEKITRDYIYLLSNMNIMDMYDLKNMLDDVSTGEFEVNKYRKKLKTLMQIHVSLEFLELIQRQLNCRYDILQKIFETALKTFRGSPSLIDFTDLSDPQLYTFSMPAPEEFMAEVRNRAPSSWMCTLSTEKKIEKKTTIFHYSRVPIFPPNVYMPDDLDKSEIVNEEMYHATVAKINHFKHYR
ncbi:protein zwilch [Chelonus insularis]|uniref:protein zwilch n=1 Tax=Chelonus insularis TaxID=460826 RepID=UPI00158ED384|nr:protein zwilch-like [Chelonus insularis]